MLPDLGQLDQSVVQLVVALANVQLGHPMDAVVILCSGPILFLLTVGSAISQT